MGTVRRLFVEKKPDFAVTAKSLSHEIRHYLGINQIKGVRVLIRYDVENLSNNVYDKATVDHNLQTPSFGSADYTYESTGNRKIYIEEGIIYEEETFEKIEKNPGFDLLETIGLKEKQKTYVRSTVYAGVEEMIQGELKLYPALKKSEEYTKGSGGGASHGW